MYSNPVKIGMASLLTLIPTVVTFVALSPTVPAAEKKSETDSRLETLLREWKKAEGEVRELHFTFQSTIEDRVLRDKQTTQGEVFFKKPNLVRIDLKDKNSKLSQIWVYKEKTIRVYDFENQTEGIGLIDLDVYLDWLTKNLSSFFQSIQWAYTAFPFDETQKSFDFHLNKEDKYWAYIQLTPRNPQEFRDFMKLEVVLNQKTHLVRQARWLTSVGDRTILDFEKVEINPTPPITWESISKDLPHWGKASNQKKQKLDSASPSSSPEQRMHELINNSEDLPKIEEEWDKFWKEPKSKAKRGARRDSVRV